MTLGASVGSMDGAGGAGEGEGDSNVGEPIPILSSVVVHSAAALPSLSILSSDDADPDPDITEPSTAEMTTMKRNGITADRINFLRWAGELFFWRGLLLLLSIINIYLFCSMGRTQLKAVGLL
jgi:hypothetical protein